MQKYNFSKELATELFKKYPPPLFLSITYQPISRSFSRKSVKWCHDLFMLIRLFLFHRQVELHGVVGQQVDGEEGVLQRGAHAGDDFHRLVHLQ